MLSYRTRIALVLAGFGFVALCLAFANYKTAPNYYTLTSIGDKVCYENFGKLYLKHNVVLDNKIKAQADCGPVLYCNTSPCNYNYVVGNSYYWRTGIEINALALDFVTPVLVMIGMIGLLFALPMLRSEYQIQTQEADYKDTV